MTAAIWWGDPVAKVVAALAVALAVYLGVVLAFRAGKRRTVAVLAPFDLAAVVAVGAITGRTATGGNSVAVGVVAVLGLLAGHWVVSRARRLNALRRLVDQPTAVLILNGRIQHRERRRTGLTRDDLDATLRNQGIRDLSEVAVAVFETRNGASVLRPGPDAPQWDRTTSSADEEN